MIRTVGDSTIEAVGWIGSVARFGAVAMRELFRPPFELREIGAQLGEIGARSAPLICASGLAVGAVMSMHTRAVFVRFGAESMIPTGLGLAMIQEIGPLVTALLVAGRVSSGIGAQLGSMRVNEQIDALEASAVDSFKYLVVTRLIACVIALPLLTTLMNFSGLLGGYLVEVIVNQISPKLYLRQAMAAIGMAEFVGATFKTVVFGFIIGSVSTHLGYYATGGSTGVGLASTRSVVRSSLLLILINVILVKGLSFFFPEIG